MQPKCRPQNCTKMVCFRMFRIFICVEVSKIFLSYHHQIFGTSVTAVKPTIFWCSIKMLAIKRSTKIICEPLLYLCHCFKRKKNVLHWRPGQTSQAIYVNTTSVSLGSHCPIIMGWSRLSLWGINKCTYFKSVYGVGSRSVI